MASEFFEFGCQGYVHILRVRGIAGFVLSAFAILVFFLHRYLVVLASWCASG